MAREKFISKRFSEESEQIIDLVDTVFTEYDADGYDVTLRQVYYVFIAKNWFPESWIDVEYNRKEGLPLDTKNTVKNYKRFGDLVGDARLAGLLDWDVMKDRGRELVVNPHWDSPADMVRAAAEQFRLDCWEDQPVHIEVMIEKDALSNVFERVCSNLDIGLTANKGYCSLSAMYEAGKRLKAYGDRGKQLVVLYCGDHDPSGIDMTRDVRERLCMFSGYDVEVDRIALNMDQVRKLKAPENPAKVTDPRAKAYIREYGEKSWELDAIEPRALDALVTQTVKKYRNERLWKDVVARQAAGRMRIATIANELAAEYAADEQDEPQDDEE